MEWLLLLWMEDCNKKQILISLASIQVLRLVATLKENGNYKESKKHFLSVKAGFIVQKLGAPAWLSHLEVGLNGLMFCCLMKLQVQIRMLLGNLHPYSRNHRQSLFCTVV